MKVIAIFGEPGSGKTTLMKKLMEKYGFDKTIDDSVKLVPFHKKDNLYILGKYEDGQVFGGTDRMSMAVQPEAIKFLDSLSNKDPNAVVIFEGDRLSTSSFLEHCFEKYDIDMFYLNTNKDVRAERYKERGSNQDETWLRGRESKISNIRSNFILMFDIQEFENNNLEEQAILVEAISNAIG
jgi:uridine kinase